MKPWLRIMVASLFSVGIALLLSCLPYLQQHDQAADRSQTFLKPDNLVDVMAQIPLRLSISRIEWNPSLVSMDLEADDHVQADAVYRDLYEIVQYGMLNTSNINQLLIRVFAKPSAVSGGSGQLLLAMNAERDKVSGAESRDQAGHQDEQQYLQSHFSFNYSPAWNRRMNRAS